MQGGIKMSFKDKIAEMKRNYAKKKAEGAKAKAEKK
ncbi:MAG: hypothetical protein PWR17_1303 [Candidatus Methanomethylophilaceae archaeon]|nr:hypothetical protein [Candidatus Methanomethylophilaceae archaeon]